MSITSFLRSATAAIALGGVPLALADNDANQLPDYQVASGV